MQWVMNLRGDLGEQYRVSTSERFILLSCIDSNAARSLLTFAEKTLEQIYGWLNDAAWRSGSGKHVILLFAEEDDYYQYVSYFYPEGSFPTTGGCLLSKDYVHIAMPYGDGKYVRQGLAHELAHNSVVHLPLPAWLNEGLAILVERAAGYVQRPILDHELRERHLSFWNPGNIQKFWAGDSFQEPTH
jgi:hypothetical protein